MHCYTSSHSISWIPISFRTKDLEHNKTCVVFVFKYFMDFVERAWESLSCNGRRCSRPTFMTLWSVIITCILVLGYLICEVSRKTPDTTNATVETFYFLSTSQGQCRSVRVAGPVLSRERYLSPPSCGLHTQPLPMTSRRYCSSFPAILGPQSQLYIPRTSYSDQDNGIPRARTGV